MSRYRVRELRPAECMAIAAWRYDGRYATYDLDDEPPDPDEGFFAVVGADDELVGYCCFGTHARVPGVDAEGGLLDVGYGMRPDLVGQGHGGAFVAAIVDFGRQRFDPRALRALVLDWNARSRAVCRHAGFSEIGEVDGGAGRFVVLERPA